MDTIELDGLTRLSHWGVIRAQGEDAAQFLHNQLSQDVLTLDATHARLAAFCTAKGRMLASMLILRPHPDEIWLLCSADVLAPTLKRLSMFVLRSKVKLSDATAELALVGYSGTACALLGAVEPAGPEVWSVLELVNGRALRLPPMTRIGHPASSSQRWLWIGVSSDAISRLQAGPALPLQVWQWLEVRSGIPMITQAVSEQFVPQMVNFELVGGVNFKKGCYPGQEIVARSQYLGKLKRRMVLLEGASAMQPGQEVFSSLDPAQPAGMVVNAAPGPAGTYSALVEVKLACTMGSDLHLGALDGPQLIQRPLPYALPTDDRTA